MHFYKLEVDFAYIYLAIHIKKIKTAPLQVTFFCLIRGLLIVTNSGLELSFPFEVGDRAAK